MNSLPRSSGTFRDWMIFLAVPFFFSSNLIFGRGIIGEVAPFTTAFLRWAGSALIVLPFVIHDWQNCWNFIRQRTLVWLMLGFLGMWICGGSVYWALEFTTAANTTLIYTTSTLFILLFQRIFDGRKISQLEFLGMIIAFAGVGAIVLKGDVTQLTALNFNIGDVVVLIAAISFAGYSMLLKDKAAQTMKSLSLFFVIALSGAITLAPSAYAEWMNDAQMPSTASAYGMLAGIIVFASIASFYCFTHVVRVFGPTTAGITLYTTPPVSIILAVTILGEEFLPYHLVGIILVIGGVILSTFPMRR